MNAIPSSIFRAYDINGIVNEQLNFDSVELISRAIGSEALANDINTLFKALLYLAYNNINLDV